MPDYATAIQCLQENLNILSDGLGNVSPQNQAMWNLSNAMLVMVDALARTDQHAAQKKIKA